MTMPDERYRAVLNTRKFLNDIISGVYDGGYWEALIYDARHCSKHFPDEFHMQKVAKVSDDFDSIDFNGMEIK